MCVTHEITCQLASIEYHYDVIIIHYDVITTVMTSLVPVMMSLPPILHSGLCMPPYVLTFPRLPL